MLIILYKIYFWLIAFPLFFVSTILTALTTSIGCLFGGEKIFSYYPGMVWSRLTCLLTLCPVKVKGREHLDKNQSYIFVSNHQSAYDIFLIYGYIGVPFKWMMRKSLEKIPFVGFACRMAGFTFVDTTSARAAQKSIHEAELSLKHNRSLIVFPEGSRSRDGRLGRFKRGAYQIAIERQLPIVPLTLNGPYKVLSIGSWDIRPHRIEMIIHPPVYPDKQDGDDKEQLQHLLETTKMTIFSDLWDEFK